MNGLVRSGASTLNARTVMPSITLPCIASLFLGTTPAHTIFNKYVDSFLSSTGQFVLSHQIKAWKDGFIL